MLKGKSIITPALEAIRAKQLKFGPGVLVGPLRKHGINCRNAITPRNIRRQRVAVGPISAATNRETAPLWSPFQAFLIKHRNDERLAALSAFTQLQLLRSWHREEPAADRRRLWERSNANYDKIIADLEAEEIEKQAMKLHFTFLGSSQRFGLSYNNYCHHYFYSGQALGGLVREPRPMRLRKRHPGAWQLRKARQLLRRQQAADSSEAAALRTKKPLALRRNRGKKGRRNGSASVMFDQTTLTMHKLVGDISALSPSAALKPMDAEEVHHWWHKGLLNFAALSPDEQQFFRLRSNEPMLWLTPNNRRALYVRFMKLRARQPDMQELKRKNPKLFLPTLAKSFSVATPEQLKLVLDTTHKAKFPLEEAHHKW